MTKIKFTNHPIGNEWFAVLNKVELCAIFQYTDKPNDTPPTGCHVEFLLWPGVMSDLDAKGAAKGASASGTSGYIVAIYKYVLETSLAFAEKQGRERCVIHSVGDEMSQRVYSTLANDLKSKREYEVQIYGFGRWIEIYKKSGKKR